MAVVLHGYDPKLRRDVAIKMMQPDRLHDPRMAARFAREARLAAQINDPHVITVYSVYDESELPFIVMEYLHGGTLQERLGNHPVSEEECIRIARQIARGLQAAHEVGLLHRDLKPSNIGFRRPSGHVVIMDFGLARTLCDTETLTLHGSPVGTPAFMSPEQILVQKLDHRTDLFSLGTVMYRMISGHLPFQGTIPTVLCNSIATCPPTPLRNYAPDVSAGLESIINRLLQKSPDRRFETASQLIEALDRVSLNTPPRRRRRRVIAGMTFASVIAGIAAYQSARQFDWQGVSSSPLPATTEDNQARPPAEPNPPSAKPATTPSEPKLTVPEFRDAAGVVWRSTNPGHAGLVSVDDDGAVRLEKPANLADDWAMVEASLVGTSATPRYLLLEIVELSVLGDVRWTAKLPPSDGSGRDVELNYGRQTGRYAFRLPEQAGTANTAVRIFIVGPDGAFVRFRDVHIADSVPEGYWELPILWTE